MQSAPEDRRDHRQRVYLTAVLERMRQSTAEEDRIRSKARALLALKRRHDLAGEEHLLRWERFLAMPVDQLAEALLQNGPEGREARHSHMFAASLPPREANRLLYEAGF